MVIYCWPLSATTGDGRNGSKAAVMGHDAPRALLGGQRSTVQPAADSCLFLVALQSILPLYVH